jgi:hypothetical protein
LRFYAYLNEGTFMRTILLFALLAFSFQSISLAQDDDIPIPPTRSRAAKIGGFVGFTPGWLSVNVNPLNAFITGAGGSPLKDNGVFMTGWEGEFYVLFILPNLRMGGVGMSGSISSSAVDQAGIRRDVELRAGWGGVNIEYVVPIVPRLDFAFGAVLGTGGIDVTLREDAGGAKTWSSEWGSFGSGNYQSGSQVSSVTRKLTGSYFIWVPSARVEYAVIGWLAIRLGVSYAGMSSPSWKLDDKYDLAGVPGDISGKGFMVNGAILIGTFY